MMWACKVDSSLPPLALLQRLPHAPPLAVPRLLPLPLRGLLVSMQALLPALLALAPPLPKQPSMTLLLAHNMQRVRTDDQAELLTR